MWSVTVKLMRRNLTMLIPAGIAILIGTAFIAATLLFGNTMGDSLGRQLTAPYAQANYLVSVADLDGLNDDEISAVYSTTVKDFQLDHIRDIQGVNDVRADAANELDITTGDDRHASGYAISTSDDASLLSVEIMDGTQPSGSNEIALPGSMADQLGLSIGDMIDIGSQAVSDQSGTVDHSVRIVGLTKDPAGAYGYYGGASIVSDDVMAYLHGVADFDDVPVTMLLLDLEDGDSESLAGVIEEVKTVLPANYTVESRQAVADQAIQSLSAGSVDITTTFLMMFGVLAMFVAALVIANTFQVLVAQRRRTLALLRVIGARKGQLHASVLAEAGLLGLVSSLLGVGVGVGLMTVVCSVVSAQPAGMSLNLILDWRVFVIPVAFGIVTTMLASLGAARAATAVSALEALRPIELTDTRKAGRIRATIGLLSLLSGVAMATFAVRQLTDNLGNDNFLNNRYATLLLTAVAGAAFIFLGVVLTAVFWMPVLMKGVGAIASRLGPSVKIAHANIQKNPRRIAATGTALLIGVTLVSTIATGAASAKETMGNALSSRYSVDIVATGINAQEADAIKSIDGIGQTLYAPTATATIDIGEEQSRSVMLVGIDDVDQLAGVMNADLSGVEMTPDGVLLPQYAADDGEDLSRLADTGVDVAPVDWASGQEGKTLPLHVQVADYRNVVNAYSMVAFVDAAHFANGDLEATGHLMLISVDESVGATLNDIFLDVQHALERNSDAQLAGPIAERTLWNQQIDSVMLLLIGLIAVAVLIALVGVANTLSLSVIERTHESATLRAIGMTRGQLRRSLAAEALLIALVSGVTGIILGTVFGWLGSYMVFSLYDTIRLPFEWAYNGIMLAVAVMAALLASVVPARRAVKASPVEALAEN